MDISLHYIKKGSGTPLLLLHGIWESGDYFVHQIDEFAERFTVYAVDTRGHGKSPRGTAPFTISQFADDLLGFMDGHGIGKADILGFSDGGNVALTFALRYPERVGRLVLNGANLDPAGVKPWIQLPIVLGYKLASLSKAPRAPGQRRAAGADGERAPHRPQGVGTAAHARVGHRGQQGHDKGVPLQAHRGLSAKWQLSHHRGRPFHRK